MENQSGTRAQKTERSGIIFVEDSCPLEASHVLEGLDVKVTNNPEDASHTIKHQNGRLFLLRDKCSLNLFSSGLKCNESNLRAFAELCRSEDETVLLSSEKRINTSKKNLSNHGRRLLRNISKKHFLPKGLDKVHKLTEEIREIDDFYSHFDSLHTLPRSIIEMDLFSGFESSQLIVHQKGKKFCDTYFFQQGKGEQHKVIPVESFNSIFTLIKKSKSKQFDQSHILKADLGILGTFMAKEFSIKNHDIVFIVSQNGFLPPIKEEMHLFDKFCNRMGSVFDFLLERNQISEKSQSINILLMNYPFAAAILTNKDQALFKNRLFCEETFFEYIGTPERFHAFKLIKDHFLIIRKPDSTKNISDIYHYQRVSLLGELLNTLQHELSNPLFGLRLTAELLESDQEDPEIRETLAEIKSNSTRCQGIIKNFSYLYQNESFTDHVEIARLVKETVVLTKSESREIAKEIRTRDLPENFKIETNPTWLSQIIFNLIVNSCQAIKTVGDDLRKHKILIEIARDKTKNELEISVSDTGPGISSSHEKDVFNPFYTTKKNGTGLGLSICNNLSSKLGGRLKYFPSANGGAGFCLTIPLSKAEK